MQAMNIKKFRTSGAIFRKDNCLYVDTYMNYHEGGDNLLDNGLKKISKAVKAKVFATNDVTAVDIKAAKLTDEEVIAIAIKTQDLWPLMMVVGTERFNKDIRYHNTLNTVRNWPIEFLYLGGAYVGSINSFLRYGYFTVGSLFDDRRCGEDLAISKVTGISCNGLKAIYGCIKGMTLSEVNIAVEAINCKAKSKKDITSVNSFAKKYDIVIF